MAYTNNSDHCRFKLENPLLHLSTSRDIFVAFFTLAEFHEKISAGPPVVMQNIDKSTAHNKPSLKATAYYKKNEVLETIRNNKTIILSSDSETSQNLNIHTSIYGINPPQLNQAKYLT